MKTDIASRDDIEQLIALFYKKLLADDSISHFFIDVVKIDLEQHLPVLADFWEMILFQKDKYRNNPMALHVALHKRSPIEPHHFETWLKYFSGTVNELFEGPVADTAKQRAESIAAVMQAKLKNS